MGKRRRSRFIDAEADEEDESGAVVKGSDSEADDVPTAEDLAFINNEEEEGEGSDPGSPVHESEKEVDSDDMQLVEDNRRASRSSRIRQVVDSESESSWSDDEKSDDSFVVNDEDGTAEANEELSESEPEELPAPLPAFQPKCVLKGRVPMSMMPKVTNFVPIESEIRKKPNKPEPTWDFMKNPKPPLPKKNKNAPKETPLRGMVRTSEGDFFVTPKGERLRVNGGSVVLNR